jgi:hypothetical protein
MSAAVALFRAFDLAARVAYRPRDAVMLMMRIERWDVRRDGPLSEPALAQKIEALGYTPAPRDYRSGDISPTECENRERVQAVVHGLIKITIDGESAILGAGDIAFVPRGGVRRVEVIGAASVRCLEAVYNDAAA